MDKQRMAIETSGAFGLAVKAVGIKAALGGLGAALLYLAAPPGRPVKGDAPIDPVKHTKDMQREFVIRLGIAVVFSVLFGDYVVDLVQLHFPGALAKDHPHPFYVAAGAPGWWITRGAALWLYKRQDQDLGETIKELKP